VREPIDAFSKLTFESQFQKISSGGAISYIEVPNMQKNIEALETMIKFIYDNIQYAEFNTKSDYCHECSYNGEIIVNEQGERECPQCHNTNQRKMNVVRRTC
jgi:ribonucleoside-triphosphate reductase